MIQTKVECNIDWNPDDPWEEETAAKLKREHAFAIQILATYLERRAACIEPADAEFADVVRQVADQYRVSGGQSLPTPFTRNQAGSYLKAIAKAIDGCPQCSASPCQDCCATRAQEGVTPSHSTCCGASVFEESGHPICQQCRIGCGVIAP